MIIRYKLMALGLAFGLLGSTCAFARPMQHFENRGPSFDKKTIASHVLTKKKRRGRLCASSVSCGSR